MHIVSRRYMSRQWNKSNQHDRGIQCYITCILNKRTCLFHMHTVFWALYFGCITYSRAYSIQYNTLSRAIKVTIINIFLLVFLLVSCLLLLVLHVPVFSSVYVCTALHLHTMAPLQEILFQAGEFFEIVGHHQYQVPSVCIITLFSTFL